MDSAGFSSVQLRERDKKLTEKHQKEVNALEAKLERYRRLNDTISRDRFDAKNRAQRLAESLGFTNVSDALTTIENSGEDSFKDCLELLGLLRKELKELREENDSLRDQLLVADAFRSKSQNATELELLKVRYDDAIATKTRAADRYKADYKKWRRFGDWMKAEEAMNKRVREDKSLSKAEKRRVLSTSIARKHKVFEDMVPKIPDEYKDSPALPSPSQDKENQSSLASSAPQPRRVFSLVASASKLPTPRTTRRVPRPDCTPLSPRVFTPNSDAVEEDLDALLTTSPGKATRRPLLPLKPNSDALEEDSDALLATSPTKPTLKRRAPSEPTSPVKPARGSDSSITEEESQDYPLPVRPSKRRSDIGVRRNNGNDDNDDNDDRPQKYRRVSDNFDLRASAATKQETPGNSSKGKEKEIDYSVYKGRGRYAKDGANTEKTINQMFEIDRSKNKGLDYQFDEVVRNKEERKKMHGGDCECCRDYYEAVGPLPPRLQPPLWRSPTGTPTKKDSVEAHKKGISRHRHDWARPVTPPGYWNIGFPSTQEVENINKKANEMQREKREAIERDANRSDGKYRKRGT